MEQTTNPPLTVLDALLSRADAELAARRRLPEATYRFQFHAGFRFQDALALVPYLHDLGVTELYSSPLLKARAGSQHGYDIVNHSLLNPEIGTPEEFDALSTALRERDLGLLLDIVPNHMGIASSENVWWQDVLENGPSSPYGSYFDIDWIALKPDLHNKVLLPILGDPYGKVLEAGKLSLSYENGAFAIHYFENRFPVSPDSYGSILHHRLPELEAKLGAESEALSEYQSILTAIRNLPPLTTTEPRPMAERNREKEVIKRRLAALTEANGEVRTFVEQNIALFNGKVGDPHSYDLLDDLLRQQAYRLSFWRVAADEINYRRFFDINELAALSMERPEVFRAAHALIFQLLADGKITGLRIDHPDGLFDPRQYLERLQHAAVLAQARRLAASLPEARGLEWKDLEGPLLERIRTRASIHGHCEHQPVYVVVEKILMRNEPIPEDWPVCGTTGYEFLNWLNGLFVDAGNAAQFTRIYNRWTKSELAYVNVVYQKKFLILQVALSSELHMLGHQLDRLSEKNRWSRDFTQNSLRHALREIIACFPVYRSYIGEAGQTERDVAWVNMAVNRAKQKNAAISASLFDYVREVLLLRASGDRPEDRTAHLQFVGKFQQVTSPVTAKGIEDTTFYVYNRLVSLNEVGGDPAQFGLLPSVFHQRMEERRADWAWALSATATHDTKRGEDVRARLNVLSEIPQEWQKALSRWGVLNRRHRIGLEYTIAPDANDEYLLYQTLLGAWPIEPFTGRVAAEFVARIQAYMRKATHEAKAHTSWVNPNPDYDGAIEHFVARVLHEKEGQRFLQEFLPFQRRVSHYGMLNSLAQTLVKIGAPGVPDVYQGTELWDFSLVDPDNRRPVDFALRRQRLRELHEQAGQANGNLVRWARSLADQKEDGRVKLYLVWRALTCRRDNRGLFTRGDYLPATAEGSTAEHVVAFARTLDGRSALVVLPRLPVALTGGQTVLPLGPEIWRDTRIVLPEGVPQRRFRNVLTGEVLDASETEGQARLAAADVFANFPVALLVAQD